ncbi:Glycine cleavage system transcriptional activator [Roseibaca ekhonensis]|jgi:LysR family glycine cleavage system transcriptional activator|uniref:Glycine cleavage system transcriptional activator n=1 Tax=Roseinatronobacter ekhonensis TaxID=254356 RepID=A0A3B0MB57_9RHOB|nr:LysR family transcriptional regulator [Roseibaca ekhonensis]SUZ33101.1 Glycine cleavage system transcriptional activator [Roseibaca ekhonensis]
MMDWRDMPPLSALRAFSAVAESGSVVAAAARLGVTHAAISQQIRSLEKALDLALVTRTGRKIELTDDGRQLAHGLGLGFGEILRSVSALTEAQRDRPLQVTTTAMFASTWLVPRLGSFRLAHPGVDLVLDPSPALRPLEPGGFDVAIRHGTGAEPGLDMYKLMDAPLVVVASPSLLGGLPDGGPDALTGLPWLSELEQNEASLFLSRQGVAKALSGGVIHLPGNLVLDAARHGQGLAVVTEVLVSADIASGNLQVVLRDQTDMAYYLATRPGVQRPPLRAFCRWIKTEAARAPGLNVAALGV